MTGSSIELLAVLPTCSKELSDEDPSSFSSLYPSEYSNFQIH